LTFLKKKNSAQKKKEESIMWRLLRDAHEHAVREASSSTGGGGGGGGSGRDADDNNNNNNNNVVVVREEEVNIDGDGNDNNNNNNNNNNNEGGEEEEEETENDDGETEEDVDGEEGENNAEATVRSDLRRVARKMKPITPYVLLFSVAFISVHWKIVSVILALFAWHLKVSESLVAEIAKKEAFTRRNVVRDLAHCCFVCYVFLFLVQTKLEDENIVGASPKMWRRATAKTPTRSDFTAWEGLFEIVAINLNARFMFDALKCLCVLTTATATTSTTSERSFLGKVTKMLSEFDAKSAKKFLAGFGGGMRRFRKKEKDDEDEGVVLDIESGGGIGGVTTMATRENDDQQPLGGKDARRPYRARGLAISAIEYAAISYKIVLPIPIWFAFFQNASMFGLLLSSALAGSYLACALFKTSQSIKDFTLAFSRRYEFGSKAFSCAHGTPATKADIEKLGVEFECAICQQKEIIAPLKLECNHVFCEECVEPWFEKDNTTCPLCRAVVVEKKKDELKSLSGGETHFLPVVF
jgi:hypothetical protein